MNTINQVALNVKNILSVNNINFSRTYVHPITGKLVSPLGHCETQGAVDMAFLSIDENCRTTNALELIKYIGKQPANMESSQSRQKAAISRGCILEGHDAGKAWKMAGEKITYLGNVNKHGDRTKSMFWKQFSTLHGNTATMWQCFQSIVNEFSLIRKDVLATKSGLVKQAKDMAGKRHCLEISEIAVNILTVEEKVKKTVEVEAMVAADKVVEIPTAEKVWETAAAEIPTAEKVWETIETAPITAAEIKKKNTLIRRK